VIYERLARGHPTNEALRDVTLQHMEDYGSAGLRTLCLAYKELDATFYDRCLLAHSTATHLGCMVCCYPLVWFDTAAALLCLVLGVTCSLRSSRLIPSFCACCLMVVPTSWQDRYIDAKTSMDNRQAKVDMVSGLPGRGWGMELNHLPPSFAP
jgi:hypothetical protein